MSQAMTINDCRPEVQAFAVLMEQQLRVNDHKPGWKDDAASVLIRRLFQEADELSTAVKHGPRDEDAARAIVGREAADVANFAMMIADVCGSLPSLPPADADVERLKERFEQLVEAGNRLIEATKPRRYSEDFPWFTDQDSSSLTPSPGQPSKIHQTGD